MAVQILFRRGTALNWASINPVLDNGEPGFEIDTGKFKIGDGVSVWASLPYSNSIGDVNLNGLTDVIINSPSNGQVLKFNGTSWTNEIDEVGSNNLDELSDVVINSPSNGQVLRFNGANWINSTPSTGGTVTNLSVTTANGFAGSVTNSTTTPAITLSTTLTGLIKGNGTAISSAIAGTDYQSPITLTTTGSSGAATLTGNVLNIPQYSGGGGGATYGISAETSTGGVNFRLSGSDASTDDVKLAEGSNITITRTNASTITISATSSGGATNLDGLSDVVVTSPSNGQVLKFNGTSWVNDTDSTGGSSLTSLDDVPGVVLTTPTNGQVLKFNGTNWINDSDLNSGTGSVSLNDVTDVVVTSPTSGQVLKFDGINWVNDTDSTGGSSLTSLDDVPGVVLTTPANGQVLKFDGTNWINDTDNTSTIFSRSSVSGSTASLSVDASENVNITGFKSYALLKIQTSAAAWVRLYSDATSRTNDASRLEGVDPLPGAGVIAEVITTSAQTIIITPGTIGFNNEGTPTTSIPIRVTNKSIGPTSITVTLTLVQLEA